MGAPAVRQRGTDAGLPSETHHTDKPALGARRKGRRGGRDEPPLSPRLGSAQRAAVAARAQPLHGRRRDPARLASPLPGDERPDRSCTRGPGPRLRRRAPLRPQREAPPAARPPGRGAPRPLACVRACCPLAIPLRHGACLCNLVSAARRTCASRFSQDPRRALEGTAKYSNEEQ